MANLLNSIIFEHETESNFKKKSYGSMGINFLFCFVCLSQFISYRFLPHDSYLLGNIISLFFFRRLLFFWFPMNDDSIKHERNECHAFVNFFFGYVIPRKKKRTRKKMIQQKVFFSRFFHSCHHHHHHHHKKSLDTHTDNYSSFFFHI